MYLLPFEVKQILNTRLIKYLSINNNLNSTTSKYQKLSEAEKSISVVTLFEKDSMKGVQIQFLTKKQSELDCYLTLNSEQYSFSLCDRKSKTWNQIKCSKMMWPEELHISENSHCLSSGEMKLFLFTQLEPLYLKKYWNKVTSELALEFNMQPSGIMIKNNKVSLIYL